LEPANAAAATSMKTAPVVVAEVLADEEIWFIDRSFP